MWLQEHPQNPMVLECFPLAPQPVVSIRGLCSSGAHCMKAISGDGLHGALLPSCHICLGAPF